MLKSLKLSLLHSAKKTRIFNLLKRSRWRRDRLLVLCYHGVALEDEHEFNPDMYLAPATFQARLALLQESGCTVLPLPEAIDRLYARDLPPAAAAITFDDGFYDFYARAWPMLRSFGFPATVYLTTYYCERRAPVFDSACYYLMWKGRGRMLDGRVVGLEREIDLRSAAARRREHLEVLAFLLRQALDTDGKESLLRRLAEAVEVDYGEFVRKRLFQLMTPNEVQQVAAVGVDVQLHTHRHRMPLDVQLFRTEIRENRDRIRALTGQDPKHFCYPSGVHRPEFLPWLASEGVISATTCEPGFACPDSAPLLLPRIVDHGGLAPVELEAWMTGCAAFIPRRSRIG